MNNNTSLERLDSLIIESEGLINNVNSLKKEKWAKKKFNIMCEEINDENVKNFDNLVDLEKEDMIKWIKRFLAWLSDSNLKIDSQRVCFYDLIRAIKKEKEEFIEDEYKDLFKFRKANTRKMKRKRGHEEKKKAKQIEEIEEEEIYNSGVLNPINGKNLNYAFFYHWVVGSGCRGGEMFYYNMNMFQIKEKISNQGVSYRFLCYTPTEDKTHDGDTNIPIERQVMENTTCEDKCIIHLYELLISKRPENFDTSKVFLQPLTDDNKTNECWFKHAEYKKGTIDKFAKRICTAASMLELSIHFIKTKSRKEEY
eukprot:TRINITY_DN705_c0_g1_i4.p1 TRINITY_DN705_c0_g1~~TRINITY_DN705_c0_g1_i4.p1  ORF type:complete len:311 (+),score=86.63 TRINITY_DN705_c0_g1_i4:138-1070(+)